MSIETCRALLLDRQGLSQTSRIDCNKLHETIQNGCGNDILSHEIPSLDLKTGMSTVILLLFELAFQLKARMMRWKS